MHIAGSGRNSEMSCACNITHRLRVAVYSTTVQYIALECVVMRYSRPLLLLWERCGSSKTCRTKKRKSAAEWRPCSRSETSRFTWMPHSGASHRKQGQRRPSLYCTVLSVYCLYSLCLLGIACTYLYYYRASVSVPVQVPVHIHVQYLKPASAYRQYLTASPCL